MRCGVDGLRQGIAVGMIVTIAAATATAQQPASIQERVRGAAKVVVGRVIETTARYERNEFGDQLIVTYAELAVDEAIKGSREAVTLEVEGGTVDGITLRVSDLPTVSKGERAVFFLKSGRNGAYEPHLRGQGILKLDDRDNVQGSSLSLAEIRRLAKEAR